MSSGRKRRFSRVAHQINTGITQISSTRAAQNRMKGWSLFSGKLSASAPPTMAAQNRLREKVRSRSGEPVSPLGVTLKLMLRLRTAEMNASTYIGAESTETNIPETPEEPSGSCGLTLLRRFQK